MRAPAWTLALLRTITPVIGSAPSRPHRALPTPWAISSRSYCVRGPVCIRSTAAAQSSVSALATNASDRPAARIDQSSSAVHPFCSRQLTAVSRLSGSETRRIGRPSAAADRRGENHGDERGRQNAQLAPRQRVPERDGGDRQQADHGRPVVGRAVQRQAFPDRARESKAGCPGRCRAAGRPPSRGTGWRR